MASCASIEKRAENDFRALQRAWDKLKAAKKRRHSLRFLGREGDSKNYQQRITKANAAIDQADGEVRAVSARINRAFVAVNRCHRRKAGR